MYNKPVSVIMSIYREQPHHLKQAIESVLTQTFSDFEFIIIADDPNNTQLINIVKDYCHKDLRIQFYINDKNMGAAKSRNRALFSCDGKYVAIMDADDVCSPDRILDQKSYLDKNSDVDVVFSGRTDIDENDNVIVPFKNRVITDDGTKAMLKYCDIITNPVVMVKNEVLTKLKGMRSVEYAEDYDLWLRCVSIGCKFHYIDKSHLNYRIRSDSLSHKNYAKTWVATKYAQKLFKQRQKAGSDSYSIKDYENFVKHSFLSSEKSTNRFNRAYDMYCNALDRIKNKNVLGAVLCFLHSILLHSEMLLVFTNSVALKKCEKEQS